MKRISMFLFFALMVFSLQGFSPPDQNSSQSEIVFNVDHAPAQMIDNVMVFDIDVNYAVDVGASVVDHNQVYCIKNIDRSQETSLEVLICPRIDNDFSIYNTQIREGINKSRLRKQSTQFRRKVSVYRHRGNNQFLYR